MEKTGLLCHRVGSLVPEHIPLGPGRNVSGHFFAVFQKESD